MFLNGFAGELQAHGDRRSSLCLFIGTRTFEIYYSTHYALQRRQTPSECAVSCNNSSKLRQSNIPQRQIINLWSIDQAKTPFWSYRPSYIPRCTTHAHFPNSAIKAAPRHMRPKAERTTLREAFRIAWLNMNSCAMSSTSPV